MHGADPDIPLDTSSYEIPGKDELEDAYKADGIVGVKEKINLRLNEWKNVPLDIAVTGNPGTGKSSLINAFRDLNADDKGSALVDVKECTAEPTPYFHPKNPKLKLWDLPGVGTKNYPRDTYVKAVDLKRFDYFLIVCCDRFTENDMWLAEQIKLQNKNFLFVRTKAGLDYDNLKKSNPKSYREKQKGMLQRLRADLEEKLGDLYMAENVFIIDNYGKYERAFEFPALQDRLVETFPAEKRAAVLRSLSALSSQMVKAKVAELRNTITYASLLSALGGACPVPGISAVVDISILVKESGRYYRELGLDEESLTKLAKLSGTPLRSLRNVVQEQITTKFTTSQGIKLFISTFPIAAAMTAGEEVLKSSTIYIPIIGAIAGAVAGAAMSFGVTRYILGQILTTLEPVAIDVIEVAFNEEIKEEGENVYCHVDSKIIMVISMIILLIAYAILYWWRQHT